MSEDIYDVIIVGAGLAGSAAAYTAAKAGLETLVVERGNFPGAKNMTGGRIYAHSLHTLLPDFEQDAPLERCVTKERISLLTQKEMISMEFDTPVPENPADRSYTVLRAKFDQWLWSKAEDVGAQLIPGIRVDSLIKENDKVTGIRAGEDELLAHVVILADGVNSILGESIGMVEKVKPSQCAVGAKEVLEFTPEQMADRFGCIGKEGMAWLFAGSPTEGHLGGGFLYTNETSVSIGLVFGLHGVEHVKESVPQMLENFKNHPGVAPLLAGGKLVEYSGHLVPEGGMNMLPTLAGDGVLLVGDAAGLCLNVGYTVRGMDLAIESGRLAAEAVIEAKKSEDFSRASLRRYVDLLRDSFILKDMELYRNLPRTLDNERIFTLYPQVAAEFMAQLFGVNGPSTRLRNKAWGAVRKIGPINLLKDGMSFMRSL